MNTQNEYLDYNDFYDNTDLNDLLIDGDEIEIGTDLSDLTDNIQYGDSIDDLYNNEDSQSDIQLNKLLQDSEYDNDLDDLTLDEPQEELPEEQEEQEEQSNAEEDLSLDENAILDDILADYDGTSELPEDSIDDISENIPNVIHKEYERSYPVETCVLSKEEPECNQCFREYNSNTDTVGYELRGNNHTLPVTHKLFSFKLLFTSADNTKYVPASTTQSFNATSKCVANQTPINPFGEILLYSALKVVEVGHLPPARNLWTQCAVTLGYSFNNTGKQLKLTKWNPLYIKCSPRQDGSAIIDIDNPYVQKLPSEADGKIYIYLGIVYNATQVELDNNHVIYYNDNTGIRVWTGKDCYTKTEIDTTLSTKQDTLISGTNIKTINNQSLIGSGNIEIEPESTEEIDIEDIRELWKQYIIHS